LQMRDQDLVHAQTQLDALAASMAQALSNKAIPSTAVSPAPQAGVDIDTADLLAGNTITINYTDTATTTAHTMTLVRVDDPSALPLSNTATATANDTVFGIDFSGGMASVITQINTALTGTGITASNRGGTPREILDDCLANTVNVDGLSAVATETSLAGGSAEFPLFTDGAAAYTGAITGTGSQLTGLAAGIAVNRLVAADSSNLIVYQAGTPAGDDTRPNFIYQQLTAAAQAFSPTTGIGTVTAPFIGSIPTYLRQFISQQGEAASSADNLKQGQEVVLTRLQQRFNDASGVNVDEEMANLLTLQSSYAANARVVSAVKDMLDALMQMGGRHEHLLNTSPIHADHETAGADAGAIRRSAASARHRASISHLPGTRHRSRRHRQPECATFGNIVVRRHESERDGAHQPYEHRARQYDRYFEPGEGGFGAGERRQQRQRRRSGSADRAEFSRSTACTAQCAGRRSLPVLRTCH